MFVVFDLDGTLADAKDREHYLQTDPKEWENFHAASVDDDVIQPVAEILIALARIFISNSRKHRIEIWTGREQKYFDETLKWLNYHGLHFDKLIMRPSGDYRKDHELKKEWLLETIQVSGQKPDIIFDDRASMVEFWRSQGIICADVAGNKF